MTEWLEHAGFAIQRPRVQVPPSLLHSRFLCRHATLLEERCVTTPKTAV